MDIETTLKIAKEFVNLEKPTVRHLEEKINFSKTSIHNCITSDELRKSNKDLYERCRKILDKNKAERHLRGGRATAQKYLNIKNNK